MTITAPKLDTTLKIVCPLGAKEDLHAYPCNLSKTTGGDFQTMMNTLKRLDMDQLSHQVQTN